MERIHHEPGCMANMRCLVYHPDGICPGPYGKCTCKISKPIPPKDLEEEAMQKAKEIRGGVELVAEIIEYGNAKILSVLEELRGKKVDDDEALFSDDPDKKLQEGYAIGYNQAVDEFNARLDQLKAKYKKV